MGFGSEGETAEHELRLKHLPPGDLAFLITKKKIDWKDKQISHTHLGISEGEVEFYSQMLQRALGAKYQVSVVDGSITVSSTAVKK